MEAMAAGRVVILPQSYKAIFEEAAVYCEPSDVEDTILHYWTNKTQYLEQSQRGFSFVAKNCSLPVVSRKIHTLLK